MNISNELFQEWQTNLGDDKPPTFGCLFDKATNFQWLQWLFGLIMSNKNNMLILFTADISLPMPINKEITFIFILWKVGKKKRIMGENKGSSLKHMFIFIRHIIVYLSSNFLNSHEMYHLLSQCLLSCWVTDL